ncbi:MAG: hypothetical protein KUG82_16180 [Pseudomonadales bacterium]|nr:hypothetical protein [Pseudomonadales bacterium]
MLLSKLYKLPQTQIRDAARSISRRSRDAWPALLTLFCFASSNSSAAEPTELPLVNFTYIENAFIGAFKTNAGRYGTGSIAYNPDNHSLFIASSVHDFGLGEYKIPKIVNTKSDLSLLNITTTLQAAEKVLHRIPTHSWPSLPIENRMLGMYYKDGKLLVNGAVYYDAPATDEDTTFIINDANDLAESTISGNFSTDGLQHTTTWFVDVDPNWQQLLGSTHLSGSGPNLAIMGRLSVGPTLFAVNFNDYLIANNGDSIASISFMDFSLKNPIRADMLNYGGTPAGQAEGLVNNEVFTEQSMPYFGFIVPGTRTYAVLGKSGGHAEGDNPYVGTVTDYASKNGTIFYKNSDGTWTDSNGSRADGYKIYNAWDKGPFYWLFDMADIVGLDNPWDAEPYESGYYKSLFPKSDAVSGIPAGDGNSVRGGSFDVATGRLYLSLPYANNASDPAWAGSPVIAVYQFDANNIPPLDPPVEVDPPIEVDPLDTDDYAKSHDCLAAPHLAAAEGTVVRVSNESALQTAISDLQENTTVLLAPGDYHLSKTLWINVDKVTIRGESNLCDDVRLIGKGMDNINHDNVLYGVWSSAASTKIQNLAIMDTYSHAIIFNGTAETPHVYNVKLVNSGEQFIKSNPVAYSDGVDGGIVEYSIMEYLDGPPATDHGGGVGYTNGVDVHAGDGWVIRNNYFKGFHNPDGVSVYNLWNPAVLIWNGARNTLVDSNIFIDVDRAIAFGLRDRDLGDHYAGVIKNNSIYYTPGLYSAFRKNESDGAIIVWDSQNTRVYHNTVLTNGNLNKAIEFRFSTAGSEVRNNLLDSVIASRDQASFYADGNIETATASLFVGQAIGDPSLKSSATLAIDKVEGISGSLIDIDGDVRGAGLTVDVGADEYVADQGLAPRAPTNLQVTVH